MNGKCAILHLQVWSVCHAAAAADDDDDDDDDDKVVPAEISE